MPELIEAKGDARVQEAWEVAASWCPIEDPRFCLGTRCQTFGVCDYNRRIRSLTSPDPKQAMQDGGGL